MNSRNDVMEFMLAAGQRVKTEFDPVFDGQGALYMELIKEEYQELFNAFHSFNVVEVADACADLIWVIEGLAHSMGIPMQKVWNEVARSNHSKISSDGTVKKREDGKVMKPDTYSPPNIRGVLYANNIPSK